MIELFNLRPHGDGWVMWNPNSEKHIMTLKEENTISSHVTHQKEGRREPLGRLFTDVDFDEDEMWNDLFKSRKLDESEYEKLVFYFHKDM